MNEVLVSVSMRFPALDRPALAEHLAPVVTAAIAAGGVHTSVNVLPYDPEEEDSGA